MMTSACLVLVCLAGIPPDTCNLYIAENQKVRPQFVLLVGKEGQIASVHRAGACSIPRDGTAAWAAVRLCRALLPQRVQTGVEQ